MALTVCGLTHEAMAAYRWLADRQLPDGSWFNYYQGDGVKDQRLDTNVCAYLAAGAWHHHLITGDVEFLGELWPTIERGIDFILRWQQPDGSVLWSLDAAGQPGGLRPPDRLVVDLPLAALRGGRGRVPGQGPARLGAGGRPARSRGGAPPRRLRAQGRVRHGLVLPHALGRARGRGGPASPGRGLGHLRHGRASACAASRRATGSRRRRRPSASWPSTPWACAGTPATSSSPVKACGSPDGSYWTGMVYPRRGHLPRERAHDLHLRRHGAGRRRPLEHDPGGGAVPGRVPAGRARPGRAALCRAGGRWGCTAG